MGKGITTSLAAGGSVRSTVDLIITKAPSLERRGGKRLLLWEHDYYYFLGSTTSLGVSFG